MLLKRILFIAVLFCSLACIFVSCSQDKHSSSLSCFEISSALAREISVPGGEFSQYSSDDIKFFFPDSSNYTDACISYSTDSTDVAEIGVLRSANEESAKALYEEVKNHIKNLQEQKREFLRNYSPNELQKLNSAQARRFGEFVVYTVSDPKDQENLFAKAEELFTK